MGDARTISVLDAAERPLTTDKVARTIFCVLVFVIALETYLHKLQHKLRHNKKYLELFNKITTEFMVVGLIYLLVKVVMYLGWIPYGGLEYQALDAADLLLFFVTIALFVQSLTIILSLRLSNRAMDVLELVTTNEIAERMQAAMATWTWPLKQFHHRKRVQMRLVSTFFRRTYGLPRLFCFAKYMRVLQEHQIVELLEIDFTTWLLLLSIFCGFFFCTGEMQSVFSVDGNSHYYAIKTLDSNLPPAQSAAIAALQQNRVGVLATLVAGLFVFMVAFLIYIEYILSVLSRRGKIDLADEFAPAGASALSDMDVLGYIARYEVVEAKKSWREAVADMQRVGDEVEDNQVHHQYGNLLLQLIASGWRRCVGKRHAKPNAIRAKIDDIHLPLFSRKACEFLIQFLLILNGMYSAMIVASVVPTMQKRELPVVVATATLLVINMVALAPRLIRIFSFVNGIYRIEAHVLGNVISHFVDVEHQKTAMVGAVTEYCRKTHQAVHAIRHAVASTDAHDGFVDTETLRRALAKFGHRMTRHNFHAFLRMMEFRTKDATVCLDDFLALFPNVPAATATLSTVVSEV
ncbi:hypothetical protein H310_03010 [Aphanomyces invadans]|uniref:EF-hand domain-containing protein n=1 Tax=Aphanomyces invadans TaxID=157072 RepID=A0A024UKF0_9STRA|nr:hypothetical protein H310_03010 [Aphanomyces invadans]ETW06886.1 hypothetical protein H310_03010 [Aphanomyces invadans]|eukprot:XP_008864961.1 hypothetical protein H310_03010 [Aphanomyces invadans]